MGIKESAFWRAMTASPPKMRREVCADAIRMELGHASLSIPTMVSNPQEAESVTSALVNLNNRISDLLDQMIGDD